MKQPGATFEPQAQGPEVINNPTGETIALRFDVLQSLETTIGQDWKEQISAVIESGTLNLRDADGHHTNREEGTTAKLGLVTADGAELAELVPGVWTLYQGEFMTMMQQALPEDAEPLRAYDDPKLALEGYAQLPVAEAGSDKVQYRMEAHTDLRYTAVLVIDIPANEADGGLLVIGNNPDAQSTTEINEDATHIKHTAATLLCFLQGRKYPHYTQEVTDPNSKRIVISLNYPLETETLEEALALLQHVEGVK